VRTSEVGLLPIVPEWAAVPGPDGDVVLASRVRLARNLAGFPFPQSASQADRAAAQQEIRSAIQDQLAATFSPGSSLDLEILGLSPSERSFLSERSLLDDPAPARILTTPDESLSLQLESIDHLRIVVTQGGFSLTEALSRAREVDRALERRLNFAVAMDWGYLSSEVTNLGTAMRVSALVHVPALGMLERLEAMSAGMEDSGYELVPFDATDSLGADGSALCLLRNRKTLGWDESTTVANLEEYARALVHYERAARQELLSGRGDDIVEAAERAFSVLRTARSLPAVEARSLLSSLRFGIVAGVVSGVAVETATTLLIMNQDFHVEQRCAREGAGVGEDRGTVRAKMIRTMLRVDHAD
jgi:protein arginine kinase